MDDDTHSLMQGTDVGRTVTHLREEKNAHKAAGIRTLTAIDLGETRDALLSLPAGAWDTPADYGANYNKEGAIRQASHVIFRFSDRRLSPIRYFEMPVWDEWKGRLLPLMTAAVRPLGYRRHFFPRVMLAKLPPGSFIPPHVDGDATGYVPHKIHIPILTNPRAFFFLRDERHHLAVGHAYEVNNGVRHSVVNGGDTDRIHLIFEYLDAEAQKFEG